jgi:hypothetical protein
MLNSTSPIIMKSLYKDYFQKSKVFLYPVLPIPKDHLFKPVQTYISWEGHIAPDERKLVCLYELKQNQAFSRFEKQQLRGNAFFSSFMKVDENMGVYVFDFNCRPADWDYFLEGKYSRMTDFHKWQIKRFYGVYDVNYMYVESFLYPGKYFEVYSDLLDVHTDLVRAVGELCDPPDLQKENLKLKPMPVLSGLQTA